MAVPSQNFILITSDVSHPIAFKIHLLDQYGGRSGGGHDERRAHDHFEQWRGGKEKGDFRGRLLQELIAEQFLKEQQKQADKWRRKGELEQSLRCEQQAPVGYAWELLEKIAKELETAEK